MGRIYQPNPTLYQVQVGDELQFESPQGLTYSATVTRASVTERGNTAIHGQAGDVKFFAVVNPDGQFFSSIETPEGNFQSYINLGETLIFSGSDGGVGTAPFVDEIDLQLLIEEQQAGGGSPPLAVLSNSTTVVTVGVLVDDTIRDNVDVLSLVDYVIGVANDSYQNSGVNIRLEIVAIANYEPYLSLSDMSTTKSWITCGSTTCAPLSGVNSAVRDWRDTHKADMVAQLIYYGTTNGGCGTAQLPWDPANITNRDNLIQYTYSVSALVNPSSGSSCPGIVVAHEMGHNFGLWHDRDTLSNQGWTGVPAPVYPYAFGYKVDGVFGTTMSYVSSNDYLLNLSNPNLSYNGYPIGVPIGQPTQAFAAQAMSNVMSYYGNIYSNVELVFYTVTSSASVGGSITPSGDVIVEKGQSTTFTLTTQQGYGIQEVTGCSGTLVSNIYTTGPITFDCSVSAQFIPVGVAPSTPQIINTDYGSEEIYLTVSVANDGGSEITNYNAICSAAGIPAAAGTSSTPRITVSGLTNGVSYTCSVRATNAAGTSAPSASSPPIVPEYIPVGLPIWLLYEASK